MSGAISSIGPRDEAQQRRAQVGRDERRVRRHPDAVSRSARSGRRRGVDLDRRLLVERAATAHDPGPQPPDDHLGRLVEALARGAHVDAEPGVLHLRQASAEADEQPPVAEVIQQRQLLDHAHGVVPRQDHRTEPELDPARPAGQVAQRQEVVGAGAVVGVEVVLRRPGGVETEVFGQLEHRRLLAHERARRQLEAEVPPRRRCRRSSCSRRLRGGGHRDGVEPCQDLVPGIDDQLEPGDVRRLVRREVQHGVGR